VSYKIADIEDKIVDALKSALTGICDTVESYHGEIDDLVSDIQKLSVKLPATFVLYAGSKFSEPANRSYDEEQAYTIIFIAKNLRGNKNLRAAIYPMIDAGKNALKDNNLGLDIKPLHPLRVAALLILKTYSVYGLDVKTSFSID